MQSVEEPTAAQLLAGSPPGIATGLRLGATPENKLELRVSPRDTRLPAERPTGLNAGAIDACQASLAEASSLLSRLTVTSDALTNEAIAAIDELLQSVTDGSPGDAGDVAVSVVSTLANAAVEAARAALQTEHLRLAKKDGNIDEVLHGGLFGGGPATPEGAFEDWRLSSAPGAAEAAFRAASLMLRKSTRNDPLAISMGAAGWLLRNAGRLSALLEKNAWVGDAHVFVARAARRFEGKQRAWI